MVRSCHSAIACLITTITVWERFLSYRKYFPTSNLKHQGKNIEKIKLRIWRKVALIRILKILNLPKRTNSRKKNQIETHLQPNSKHSSFTLKVYQLDCIPAPTCQLAKSNSDLRLQCLLLVLQNFLLVLGSLKLNSI